MSQEESKKETVTFWICIILYLISGLIGLIYFVINFPELIIYFFE